MSNALQSYQTAFSPTAEKEDVPEWAQGVLSTTKGRTMGVPVPGEQVVTKVVEQVDEETGLPYFRVPGLCVLAIEATTDPGTVVEVAERLKAHELDVAAIAFAGPISYQFEQALAARGILIAESDADSPRTRARQYAKAFAARTQRGVADLERFFADAAAQRGTP